MFKLSFDTANAAFDDDLKWMEIDRILRGVADRAGDGQKAGKIHDINGNGIGGFELDEGPAPQNSGTYYEINLCGMKADGEGLTALEDAADPCTCFSVYVVQRERDTDDLIDAVVLPDDEYKTYAEALAVAGVLLQVYNPQGEINEYSLPIDPHLINNPVPSLFSSLELARGWIDAERESPETGEGQQAAWLLSTIDAALAAAKGETFDAAYSEALAIYGACAERAKHGDDVEQYARELCSDMHRELVSEGREDVARYFVAICMEKLGFEPEGE